MNEAAVSTTDVVAQVYGKFLTIDAHSAILEPVQDNTVLKVCV
jgi:hypothetical protein